MVYDHVVHLQSPKINQAQAYLFLLCFQEPLLLNNRAEEDATAVDLGDFGVRSDKCLQLNLVFLLKNLGSWILITAVESSSF